MYDLTLAIVLLMLESSHRSVNTGFKAATNTDPSVQVVSQALAVIL